MSHKKRQGNPARRHGNLLGFALAAGAKLGSAPESLSEYFSPSNGRHPSMPHHRCMRTRPQSLALQASRIFSDSK